MRSRSTKPLLRLILPLAVVVGTLLAPAALDAKPGNGHAFGRPSPRPTATATPTPSPTRTPAPTPSPVTTPSDNPSPVVTSPPSPTPTVAPTPTPTAAPPTNCVEVESQAWWRRAGIVIPTDVGSHVHLKACMPRDGTIITSNTLAIPFTVTLHDQSGAATWIRGCIESGSTGCTTLNLVPALGPCTDCTRSGTFNLDLSSWPDGRRELRLLVNVPTNDEGNRQFATDGWPICVNSCTAADPRGGIFWTMRGWYTANEYQNVRVDDPITGASSGLRPGGTVHIVMGPGSPGLATTFSGAFLNPDFHHDSAGTVLLTRNGPFNGNITLPSNATGRLVLVASDGQNAGVGAFPVNP